MKKRNKYKISVKSGYCDTLGFPSCTSDVLTKVKAKMIDVNVLLTCWQFFRIKCTFVFCLSFLNETEKKKDQKVLHKATPVVNSDRLA